MRPLQVRPAHSAARLCGVPDALHAHGVGGEDAASVRARAAAPGRPDGRGPLHDALQQDREAAAAHEHHGLHGQLQRQHADAYAGKEGGRERGREVGMDGWMDGWRERWMDGGMDELCSGCRCVGRVH